MDSITVDYMRHLLHKNKVRAAVSVVSVNEIEGEAASDEPQYKAAAAVLDDFVAEASALGFEVRR